MIKEIEDLIMEVKRIHEITYSFLVNASELAFIEEAEGTNALLSDFYYLFKYLTSEEQTVTLFDELEIVMKYVLIQKAKYNNRFTIKINNIEEYKSIYILRSLILEYFDNILCNIIEDVEGTVDYLLELETREGCCLKLVQKIGNKSVTYKKDIA